MKRTHVMISAAVACLAMGAAYFFHAPPASLERDAAGIPASPRNESSQAAAEPVQPGESLTPERSRQLALEIERTLVARDPRQLETALNVLLPQLIEADPAKVVTIVARQAPGEMRDALRDEVTRQWIRQDRDAAIEWIGTLEETERKTSAALAMRTLAASEPAHAIFVADRFGVGRDDGSLEYIVQIWATENPDAAMRWLDKQPANDPRTEQLRARIEQVRAQQTSVSQ